MNTDSVNSIDPTRCPLCGGINDCARSQPVQTAITDCWCSHIAISPQAIAKIPPALINRACLCPRCAQLIVEENP